MIHRSSSAVLILFFIVLVISSRAQSQEQAVLVPKPVPGAPFQLIDKEDLFGKAYRWFLEGRYELASDTLRKLVAKAGFELEPDNYYIVVPNFTKSVSPIGLFYEDQDYFKRRFYGLEKDNLYYIFITRQREGKSFLSVLATEKASPFVENLPLFLGLLQQPFQALEAPRDTSAEITYVDVRRFNVPKAFRKYSDISVIVKPALEEEEELGRVVFDNTSLERWSYGIATAITSEQDVDLVVNPDGKITVRPKPNLDLAAFAVVNYHFKAVDTKAPALASSVHLLGGLRMIDFLEPIVGIGAGIPVSMIELHLFTGFSFEFANALKSGYAVNDPVSKDEHPFKTEIRPKFRFGIEVKFP